MTMRPNKARLFFEGFGNVMRAWRLIADHRLWPYYLVPLLLDFVLGASVFAFIHFWSDEITQSICGWLGIATDVEWNAWSVWDWIRQASSYVIRFLVYIGMALVYWSIRKNLLIALCSPIMALLSDRVEEILTGQQTPFNGPQFVRDIVRGALLAVRNLLVECGVSVVIFVLSLLISWIGGPLALVALPLLSIGGLAVSSYYFGSSLIDYSLERRKLSIGETLAFNRRNKFAIVGVGAAFHVLLMIPVIGIALAVVLGTTGATHWMVNHRSSHQ